MAYETGALAGTVTLADLMVILGNFLSADGWTVHTNSGGTLHASADDCHVNLVQNTTDTLADTLVSGSAAPDHGIYGKLAPNSTPLSNVGSGDSRVRSNDFTPPYANYWIFSGAVGEPKYCHLVVQKANGRFCHIEFGNLDKKGMTYQGGAYLGGLSWDWGFNAGSADSGTDDGSDIDGANNFWLGNNANTRGNFSGYNIYLGELDTDRVIYPQSSDNLVELMSSTGMTNVGNIHSGDARWLGHIFFLGPNPINGVSPLFERPCLWWNPTNSRSRFLGTIPGARFLSMIGRVEAETVTFGGDSYVIFPFKRGLPWEPEPWEQRIVTSGPYGFALKVNA